MSDLETRFERSPVYMLRDMVTARGILGSDEATKQPKKALAALLAEDEETRLACRAEWTRTERAPMYTTLQDAPVYSHIRELVTQERMLAGLPDLRAVVLGYPGAQDALYVEVLEPSADYDDLDVVAGSVEVQHDAANTVRGLLFEDWVLHFRVDPSPEEGTPGEARSVDLGGYAVFAKDAIRAKKPRAKR